MKRLELLDYGRFAAVLSVMGFHYFFNGITNGKITSITHIPELITIAKYGSLGVEFFFMISGYVIFFSASTKTAGQFIASRSIRLFPAFWIAAIFTSVISYFWGGQMMSVTIPQLALNLTMFPNFFNQPYVDGVYWTLFYEWKFYFLIFIALVLGLQSKLQILFLMWPIYIFATQLTGLSLPYTSGYYCYFAAGALFAIKKDHKSLAAIFALLLCFYLCIVFSTEKAMQFSKIVQIDFSIFVVSLIILFQFSFFIGLNSKIGSSLNIKGSRLAGDLTYPIYLIHAHFGYMFISKFAHNENRIYVYVITISIVMILAYLINHFFEKKISKVWNIVFSRSLGRAGDLIQHLTSNGFKSIQNYAITLVRR